MNFLFYLLLLLLPTQLGYHFWPESAFVWGLRIDYLSPTIYLTDLLVVGILVRWGVRKLKVKRLKLAFVPSIRPELPSGLSLRVEDMPRGSGRGKVSVKSLKFLFLLFLFFILNCLGAENKGAAVYKLVKIIEFGFLGWWVAKNSSLRKIAFPLLWAVVYSSLIAMAQFLKQASLGGIFWWLGERTFNSSTSGIAMADFFGRQAMRSYGTFSHPNCLAGFLLVGGILILGKLGTLGFFDFSLDNFRQRWTGGISLPSTGFRQRRTGRTGRTGRMKLGTLGIIGLWFGAILMTFSRSGWITGLLITNCLLLIELKRRKKEKGKRWIWGFLGILGGLGLVLLGFLGDLGNLGRVAGSLSFQRRWALNKEALEMIKASPLIGVGLNNFIPRLPEFWGFEKAIYFLQPVHNIYLLVGAELGLIGALGAIGGLCLTIKRVWREKNWSILWALVAILLTGLADHYWLTLQQNQLLLAIVLGLAWRET